MIVPVTYERTSFSQLTVLLCCFHMQGTRSFNQFRLHKYNKTWRLKTLMPKRVISQGSQKCIRHWTDLFFLMHLKLMGWKKVVFGIVRRRNFMDCPLCKLASNPTLLLEARRSRQSWRFLLYYVIKYIIRASVNILNIGVIRTRFQTKETIFGKNVVAVCSSLVCGWDHRHPPGHTPASFTSGCKSCRWQLPERFIPLGAQMSEFTATLHSVSKICCTAHHRSKCESMSWFSSVRGGKW